MAKSKSEKLGLPEELIIDILFRLPVKSIGVFRCVSKHWRDFLSDPQFIKAHLIIHGGHKVGEQKLILASFSLCAITLTQNPQDEMIDVVSKKVNLQLNDNWISVDGSCNGLVLVGNQKNSNFLINPTTLKYHEIPKFRLALPEEESKCMYGFGYDIVSDDYKVVALSFYATEEHDTNETFVDIYSVKKGLWRRIESSPYDHSRAEVASGVLVNGALHWLTSRTCHYSRVISAFNLSDEIFFEVPLPVDGWVYFDFELVALRGRLCMFTNIGVDTIRYYLMEDYGNKESWAVIDIAVPSLKDIFCTPLCSMTDDDVVMDAEDKLIVYNMKEDVLWDPSIDSSHYMNKARTFIDSLVSPSYGNGTEA